MYLKFLKNLNLNFDKLLKYNIMAEIKAADVSKLRKITGAGMMDCKNALKDADGNFDRALEIIREKGKLIANKRADREASEGVVLAKVTDNKKFGAVVVLNCETDFVAKNEDFTSCFVLNCPTQMS